MVEAYWNIGKSIVEQQDGYEKAEYGSRLIAELSKQMIVDFGKGFTLTKHSFAHVILIEINRDLVLLVIKVNLYISVAWETVECEKIVNAYCKKRYKSL